METRTLWDIAVDHTTPLSDLALVNALPVWAVRHIKSLLALPSAPRLGFTKPL